MLTSFLFQRPIETHADSDEFKWISNGPVKWFKVVDCNNSVLFIIMTHEKINDVWVYSFRFKPNHPYRKHKYHTGASEAGINNKLLFGIHDLPTIRNICI